MNIRSVTAFFVIIFLSSVTHAASYYGSPLVSGWIEKIDVIGTYPSKRDIIVTLKEQLLCDGKVDGYFNKLDSPETFSALLSLLFSAKATGDKITVYASDGEEGCRIDRVTLN